MHSALDGDWQHATLQPWLDRGYPDTLLPRIEHGSDRLGAHTAARTRTTSTTARPRAPAPALKADVIPCGGQAGPTGNSVMANAHRCATRRNIETAGRRGAVENRSMQFNAVDAR